MTTFTPISSLIGGSLIGLSAILLFLLNGRIAGISGIFHGLFPIHKNDFFWRLLFLIGLIAGSLIYYIFPQIHFTPRSHFPISLLLLAGFLVGIGTRLGGGCTSGHGVCGIARLSFRSFVATVIFFVFGVITVYFVRHIWNII
ncbi:MAG: YeeE/YedE family protein [Gammaproteobacteria bacterium]|nr:YeeE/YedE family protein [Gammaproteobacteria bacterium]